MNLILTILIGVGIGVMVELLLPGHTPAELALAMLLGIAGALLARFIGFRVGWFDNEDPNSFIAAGVGAIVILALYGLFFRRNRRQH